MLEGGVGAVRGEPRDAIAGICVLFVEVGGCRDLNEEEGNS